MEKGLDENVRLSFSSPPSTGHALLSDLAADIASPTAVAVVGDEQRLVGDIRAGTTDDSPRSSSWSVRRVNLMFRRRRRQIGPLLVRLPISRRRSLHILMLTNSTGGGGQVAVLFSPGSPDGMDVHVLLEVGHGLLVQVVCGAQAWGGFRVHA